MLKNTALNLVAMSLAIGLSAPALADAPQQVAQAQQLNRTQADQVLSEKERMDFQTRLNAAKTPEERARVQAEYDRMIESRTQQQGAVPRTSPTSPMPETGLPQQRDSGSGGSDSGSGGSGGSSGGGSGGGSR